MSRAKNPQTREACQEIAFRVPGQAEKLRELQRELGGTVAYHACGDLYRFKELADIMAWKKPPKE
jgi:hypothetical protein